jgi:hypothetical protein
MPLVNESARLRKGQIFRLQDKLFVVEDESFSSVLVRELSRRDGLIRTRKGQEKAIKRRPAAHRISSTSIVQVLSKDALEAEELKMAEAVSKNATYVRTEQASKKEMKGQGAIVFKGLEELGGKATADQLTEHCKGKFVGSRQPDGRIVRYYLTQFKRDGLVTAINPPAPEKPAEGQPAAEAELAKA